MKKLLSTLALIFLLVLNVISQPPPPPSPPATCCPNFYMTAGFEPCDTGRCQQPNSTGGVIKTPIISACKNTTIAYQVYPALSGFTYTWTVIGGVSTPSSLGATNILWGSSSGGLIQVIISNSNASCTDTLMYQVCLKDAPNAAFTYSPLSPVCKNVPITFNNTSTGGAAYSWDFGDGTSSTAFNPTHSYSTPGIKTVILTVWNYPTSTADSSNPINCSCKDTAVMTIDVSNISGIIISPCCKAMLCAGQVGTYCINGTSCTGTVWSVIGGTIQSQTPTSVTVLWNLTMPLPPSITFTGSCGGLCGTATTYYPPILYNNMPINGNQTPCVGSNNTYSLPALPGTFYTWSVAGGTIQGNYLNTSSVSINWPNAGIYSVSCSYTNPYTKCSGSSSYNVTVSPVYSIFGSSKTCQGTTETYYSGTPANWVLQPGNIALGGPSTSISYLFSIVGTYIIQATIPSSAGYCNTVASIPVQVNPTPTLGAASGPLAVCQNSPQLYSMTHSSGSQLTWATSANSSILSTIGDDNDSAVIQFSGVGPYIITVTATNDAGCTATGNINVVNPTSQSFTGSAPSACVDDTLTFTATGSLPLGSYNWSISPAIGTILTGQGSNQVTIVFNGGAPSATVSLSTCNNSTSISIVVPINVPAPTTISYTGYSCSPTGITLTATTSGFPAPPRYDWFQNGSSIGSTFAPINTVNVFSAGYYIVKPKGCFARGEVNVPTTIGPATTISTSDPLTYCPVYSGQVVNLVASQTLGCTYQWQLNGVNATGVGNNTANYATNLAGSYTCIVTDANGCFSVSNTLVIGSGACFPPCSPAPTGSVVISKVNRFCPTGSFSAQLNYGTNTLTSICWSFGDGSPLACSPNVPTGSSSSISHNYTTVGNYLVTATMTLNGNCTFTDTFKIQVPLLSLFNANIVCNKVFVTNNSQFLTGYSGYSNSWVVSTTPCGPAAGGVTASPSFTSANPIFTFAAPGTYYLCNTISAAGCSNTSPAQMVVITSGAAPVIVAPSTICIGTSVLILATTSASLPAYSWNFGDASTSYVNPTNHTYLAGPSATISLTVTDAYGCSTTASKPIVISPKLTATIITPLKQCIGSADVIAAPTLSSITGSPSYQWYHDGVAIPPAAGTNSNLSATFILNYYVVVTSNGGGCVATSNTVQALFNKLPKTKIQGKSNWCAGAPISLASQYVQGSYVYAWSASSPSVVFTTASSSNPNITAPAGSYTVFLDITDNITGCHSRDSTCLIVDAALSVNLVATSGIPCAGNANVFTANVLAPPGLQPYLFQWNTGASNAVSTSLSNSITVSASGVYNVTVTNTTNGCSAITNTLSISGIADLSLFPSGCDSLCTKDSIYAPLPMGSGPLGSIYTSIKWYDNGVAIPGIPAFPIPYNIPVSALTGSNPHHITASVGLAPNGCVDSFVAFDVNTKICEGCDTSCHFSGFYYNYLTPNIHPALVCGSIIQVKCSNDYHFEMNKICGGVSTPLLGFITKPDGTSGGVINSGSIVTPNKNGLYTLTYYSTFINALGDTVKCDSCIIKVNVTGCPTIPCCRLNILSDTIRCINNQVQFVFNVSGCGKLYVSGTGVALNGSLAISYPYVLSATPIGFTGTYTGTDSSICIRFQLLDTTTGTICKDTLICRVNPCYVRPCCNLTLVKDSFYCSNDTSRFILGVKGCGTLYVNNPDISFLNPIILSSTVQYVSGYYYGVNYNVCLNLQLYNTGALCKDTDVCAKRDTCYRPCAFNVINDSVRCIQGGAIINLTLIGAGYTSISVAGVGAIAVTNPVYLTSTPTIIPVTVLGSYTSICLRFQTFSSTGLPCKDTTRCYPLDCHYVPCDTCSIKDIPYYTVGIGRPYIQHAVCGDTISLSCGTTKAISFVTRCNNGTTSIFHSYLYSNGAYAGLFNGTFSPTAGGFYAVKWVRLAVNSIGDSAICDSCILNVKVDCTSPICDTCSIRNLQHATIGTGRPRYVNASCGDTIPMNCGEVRAVRFNNGCRTTTSVYRPYLYLNGVYQGFFTSPFSPTVGGIYTINWVRLAFNTLGDSIICDSCKLSFKVACSPPVCDGCRFTGLNYTSYAGLGFSKLVNCGAVEKAVCGSKYVVNVSDNCNGVFTNTIRKYITDPNGFTSVFNTTFTPSIAGTYIIKYYKVAFNSQGDSIICDSCSLSFRASCPPPCAIKKVWCNNKLTFSTTTLVPAGGTYQWTVTNGTPTNDTTPTLTVSYGPHYGTSVVTLVIKDAAGNILYTCTDTSRSRRWFVQNPTISVNGKFLIAEIDTANDLDSLSFQWYRNDTPVVGQNRSYVKPDTGILVPGGERWRVGVSPIGTLPNPPCDIISKTDTIYRTDINELNAKNWTLYPNPANGSVKLFIGDNLGEEMTIKVIDAIGKEVYISTLDKGTLDTSIDLSSLASGVYNVMISNTQYRGVKRLVVTH